MRCLFGPFAHPFFTSFIGIGIGIAVTSRNRACVCSPPSRGTWSPCCAHAAWNGSLLLDDGRNAVASYVFLMVPAFLLLAGFATWSRRREGAVLTAALTDCAQRGFLDPAEIPWLSRIPARRFARRYAEKVGGRPARRTMVDYQLEAVELGFLHSRYLRGVAPPDFAQLGQEHVDRMRMLRPGLIWPQPSGMGGVPQMPHVGGPGAGAGAMQVTHPGHSAGPQPGQDRSVSESSAQLLATLTACARRCSSPASRSRSPGSSRSASAGWR